jgi:HK97 gp10 family phage protein
MAKLVSDLTRIALQAPEKASEALLQTAADIVDLTKQLTPVDTGNLKRSYGATPLSKTTVRIGTDVEYAPFVEYGTVHQTAQPHLTPAFMQNEATFQARLLEKMKELE